jgi:Fur family ferric uptake transcriptional regulator
MARAHRTNRLAFDDIESIAAAVRRRGGRFSAARRIVLEVLFEADGPVSAERIAQGGDGRTMLDLTSVYRGLEYLEQLGVVRHVHVGHGPGLYALIGDTEVEYLACERCDRVKSVPSAQLDPVRAAVRKAFGYEARFSHFPIVGLCPACAAVEGDACADAGAEHGHLH